MKLLRLKITDPKGFRSLQAGFEYKFRNERALLEEHGFAPFVCAGPNGSGKSNLLEVLAAIFYHMECIYLENKPDIFQYDDQDSPNGFRSEKAIPDGFEVEYVTPPKDSMTVKGIGEQAHVLIVKEPGKAPQWSLLNHEDMNGEVELIIDRTIARQLLPDFLLAYSSGENEILSLPFFKMRFIQFDEYWQTLRRQDSYPSRPESRMAYLDNEFSQAILLCNLLFQDEDALAPYRTDVGIEELTRFQIIIKRSVELSSNKLEGFIGKSLFNAPFGEGGFAQKHPAVSYDDLTNRYTINILRLLESDGALAVSALKRCATCWFLDESTDTLYFDYVVNDATKGAFRENFSNDPLELFQTFRVLLTLNLYSVSDALKSDLYQSDSYYVGETVPTLASDERIMRFKFVEFSKVNVVEPVLSKSLSDGEHQLLHTLGLCLLFKDKNCLFLLDEPETHFNPDWRANFITRLHDCFAKAKGRCEMLITTHTPFLISDSKPDKVLVFEKDRDNGAVLVDNPQYNTLGASINKITMETFGTHKTIGGYAQTELAELQKRFDQGEDKEQLYFELNQKLGDSVEKILLLKTIFDSTERTV
ncbi:MAG: restriction system-associated AAA family ATPase [Halodesulfovibrio sp.]|uniref:restriction system-associated AAA family ATPase n=1 Tax=Halodesulfovibrio sp. TaxID=1912772 RepID=UPI00359E130C